MSGAPGVYHPTRLETAWGWVAGQAAEPPPRPRRDSPRAALETLLLDALDRPPCCVTFSGGRDSSALLAAGVAVARRYGTALPIPITHLFRNAPATEETAWQERVIRHLGLTEWVRQEYDDELDLIGPISQVVLGKYGLLWPPRLFAERPIMEAARGGTVITGEGGDEVLGGTRVTPVLRVVKGVQRFAPATLAAAGDAMAPRFVRRVRRTRGEQTAPAWLRSGARASYRRAVIADELSEPLRWDRAVRRLPYRRSVRAGLVTNLDTLAADENVRYVHPFLEPAFVDAVAGLGGRWGFVSRTDAMVALFGDLLPAAVLGRTTKATFTAPAVSTHSREFINHFDGTGIDMDLVDADALLEAWNNAEPDARSFLLLQQAWLARRSA